MTFDTFSQEIHSLLDATAKSKGYNDTGADGDNQLFSFCQKMGLGHAEGEIVYKVVRYHKKRNPEDLLKIAAWAFLLWRTKDGEN